VAKNLISVIDDDESVRRTTTRLIESFGFRAAAFESAENFLGSGHLNDTSCLIVDVQMPGMNGLQLQSQLAAADCRIPIIFITAYDDKESRRRAMQAGAIAFLGKPFRDEQLLESIRLALHELDDEPGAARNLISIIDDDESVRRTTTRLIESFGFRAAAFESAESFLSSGQLDCSLCLIVDVRMPGINGVELQSQLAATDCRIPIIFITAYDDKESRWRAMQAGAVAFLAKPFTDEQLLQWIRSVLRHEKGGVETTRFWTR
jgi:FixJ family two-component response regulator